MLFPKSKIHFIGIGGVGMRGLAEWSLKEGHQVTGSDSSPSEATRRLESLGAIISSHHPSPHVVQADLIVGSSAIGVNHVELVQAKSLNKVILLRGEFLGELSRSRHTIGVCGSHGKSTTTALIGHCLRELWPSHTYVGARVNAFGSSYHFGDPRRVIAEVDESDGTFLKFPCDLPVLTGLSQDHVTFYGSPDNLWDAFRTFLQNSSNLQRPIVCGDDPLALQIAKQAKGRVLSYGLSERCDIRASAIISSAVGSTFNVHIEQTDFSHPLKVHLPLLGKHNVVNALAAIAVGVEFGLDIKAITSRLENFAGVERRLEKIASNNSIDVYSDYAHNPEKIAAALAAVSAAYGSRSVLLVVEPHRYTRVHSLWKEFVSTLQESWNLALLPIYSAGESPIAGVSSEGLENEITQIRTRAKIPQSGQWIEALNPTTESFSAILEQARNQSNGAPFAIVFVGAGKSHEYAHSLASLLERTREQKRPQTN